MCMPAALTLKHAYRTAACPLPAEGQEPELGLYPGDMKLCFTVIEIRFFITEH